MHLNISNIFSSTVHPPSSLPPIPLIQMQEKYLKLSCRNMQKTSRRMLKGKMENAWNFRSSSGSHKIYRFRFRSRQTSYHHILSFHYLHSSSYISQSSFLSYHFSTFISHSIILHSSSLIYHSLFCLINSLSFEHHSFSFLPRSSFFIHHSLSTFPFF